MNGLVAGFDVSTRAASAGRSTTTTSQPRSARIIPQYGPVPGLPSSMTRSPLSGPMARHSCSHRNDRQHGTRTFLTHRQKPAMFPAMELGYTAEQEALRAELREYYEKLLDPDTVAELAEGHGIGAKTRERVEADVRRRLGRHRLAEGVRRPGQEPDRAVHLLRRVDALRRAGADAQHQHRRPDDHAVRHRRAEASSSCPKILAGDLHFCIGYSEPGAGTDLASLKTRAVRDGDEYIINGQKMWTSLANGADYCWLAVRTNPEVAKHKGISIIIVPLDTPGITIQPLSLIGEHDINAVFYDNVRVPAQVPRRRGERRLEADHQPAQPRAGHAVLARGVIDRAYNEVTRLGQGHRRRCPTAGRRDRSGVGADQPRQGARQARVLAPDQLEGRVGVDAGRARRRRRVDGQGVRHRVLPGGRFASCSRCSGRSATSRPTRRARCCDRGWSRATAAW